jgi:uncharacterized integral membrane protein (TIGR00698 family)
MRAIVNLLPGILLVSLLAVVAFIVSKYVSLSANLNAIILGFLVANLVLPKQPQLKQKMQPGCNWCEAKALAIAVALLGAQLNMTALLEVNQASLLLIIFGLLLTFLITMLLAKIMKVSNQQACLLASGQGICGSAAVMATQSVIKAPSAQVGMVVALVNFLGFVGVFITVWLASWFFSGHAEESGILIGNTLQSMGHVVAAGFSLNEDVGHFAVLIKMCRILLLIPVLLIIIFINGKAAQNKGGAIQIHWFKLIPYFIWVFLLLSFMTSMEWLPSGLLTVLSDVSKWLFLLAMTAIGLSIEVKYIHQSGSRVLLLGLLVFCSQLVFSVWFLVNF